jgi:hypothetical protein
MEYKMNLPPRYVKLPSALELCDSSDSSGSDDSVGRVQFDDHANQTFSVSRYTNDGIWYTGRDYARFGDNFKHFKSESITRPKRKRSLFIGEREIPPMETYQTFGTSSARRSRRMMSKSILLHQATCRARGYLDPAGLSLVSKALSKHDRNQAWQAGALNAYETEWFRKEERKQLTSSESVSTLFLQYYLDNVHPLFSTPLTFLSKVLLCECD